jgi:hypothetical protein
MPIKASYIARPPLILGELLIVNMTSFIVVPRTNRQH